MLLDTIAFSKYRLS